VGMYINTLTNGTYLPARGKADALLKDGATELTPEEARTYRPFMVCVVENSSFDAAGFAYDREEFAAFSMADDRRKKRWFLAEAQVRRNFLPSTIEEHLLDYQVNQGQEVTLVKEPREQFDARIRQQFGNDIAIIHLEDYD